MSKELSRLIQQVASATLYDDRVRICAEIQEITDAMQARIAELETQDEALPVSEMDYIRFASEAKRRLVNSDRNWQIVFERQTGLSRARFSRFSRMGKVDRRDYIKALAGLVAEQPGERAHRDVWTIEQVNRVRLLTQSGSTEASIAKILTRMTGRNITENVIKRLKLNSRQRQGVFRDDAFGGPIGTSR